MQNKKNYLKNMMNQSNPVVVKINTMCSKVLTLKVETIMKLWFMFSMVSVCAGEARQYGQSRNELFSRPKGGLNRRNGGKLKLLTPDESNADVLKELGVDLSNEGKLRSKSFMTSNE